MSSITKIYKSKFKEILLPYSFKLYRKTFYRVINDVVQIIMLNNWDRAYTVSVAIKPLLFGIKTLDISGEDGLHELREGNFQTRSRQWDTECEFTGKILPDEVISKMVDEMVFITVSKVLPAFERGCDLEKGWDEMYELFAPKRARYVNVREDLEGLNHINIYGCVLKHDYEGAIDITERMITVVYTEYIFHL